ncbi:MAG TPA: hypothetical protein VFI27_21720 [candidate division Zixibacteria bacterium]|nr:hypothetical protein [candidate division Zixibacteria bacterium]
MKRDLVTRIEVVFSLVLAVIGIVLSLISLGAEILGLDLTPGFGIVQMFQLLLGLTLLTIAGYVRIHSLRSSDAPRSLQADIGIRLGATGLVFAYVSGISDLIGIGTHVQPSFGRPFVGPLQLGGLLVGVLMITAGLILYMTSRGSRQTSSLESLLKNDKA